MGASDFQFVVAKSSAQDPRNLCFLGSSLAKSSDELSSSLLVTGQV